MMSLNEQQQIVQLLRNMNPELVRQVLDFTLFLKERHPNASEIDESDSWSEEDMRDATMASLCYADETLPYE